MLIFPRKQQWRHLFCCETNANKAIISQSWDYLVYPRDLAVHKDHLPYRRMTSQSALLLWCHLLTAGNIIKCLHDDISGPCVILLILVPERAWTVPLNNFSPFSCNISVLLTKDSNLYPYSTFEKPMFHLDGTMCLYHQCHSGTE